VSNPVKLKISIVRVSKLLVTFHNKKDTIISSPSSGRKQIYFAVCIERKIKILKMKTQLTQQSALPTSRRPVSAMPFFGDLFYFIGE
jgi:hypothetical protein